MLEIFSGQLNLTGGVWGFANNFDLNQAGFIIVGLFVVTWAAALAIWKFGRIEEKWFVGMQRAEGSASV